MKTYTNHTPGTRGINVADGKVLWIDPGQSVEIDPKTIVGDLPDLGKPSGGISSEDADLISSVESENAGLKKQVADLTRERDDHKAEAEASAKSVTDLTTENAGLKTKLEAATKK